MSVPPHEILIEGGFCRILDPVERSFFTLHRLKRHLRTQRGLRRRQLARLLRALEMSPLTVAEAAEQAPGSLVRLAGLVRAVTTSPAGAVWWMQSAGPQGGTTLIEIGYDFLLDDGTADPARVVAAGAHLLDTTDIHANDPVSVVGFLDRQVDATAARARPRAAPTRAILRSSVTLPLLVRAFVTAVRRVRAEQGS